MEVICQYGFAIWVKNVNSPRKSNSNSSNFRKYSKTLAFVNRAERITHMKKGD